MVTENTMGIIGPEFRLRNCEPGGVVTSLKSVSVPCHCEQPIVVHKINKFDFSKSFVIKFLYQGIHLNKIK